MPFDRKTWQYQDVKEVELSGGRVAVIRPLPAHALTTLSKLPVTAALRDSVAAGRAELDKAENQEQVMALVQDTIVAGTVLPEFVTDRKPEPGTNEVDYAMLGLGDAVLLFREILTLSKLATEDLASASEFRNE